MELDAVLGSTLALVQKGLTAENDFHYARRHLDDYEGTVSYSAFRQSFAVLAVCYKRAEDFPVDLQGPGFLQGYPL